MSVTSSITQDADIRQPMISSHPQIQIDVLDNYSYHLKYQNIKDTEILGWLKGIPEVGLVSFWVNPNYRRQGIASTLLSEYARILTQLGHKWLILTCEPDNDAAIHFLKHHWFETNQERETKNYIPNPVKIVQKPEVLKTKKSVRNIPELSENPDKIKSKAYKENPLLTFRHYEGQNVAYVLDLI